MNLNDSTAAQVKAARAAAAKAAPVSASVGYAAQNRFLRPVALQDAPGWLIQQRGQA